jgi:hypothetical protein
MGHLKRIFLFCLLFIEASNEVCVFCIIQVIKLIRIFAIQRHFESSLKAKFMPEQILRFIPGMLCLSFYALILEYSKVFKYFPLLSLKKATV